MISTSYIASCAVFTSIGLLTLSAPYPQAPSMTLGNGLGNSPSMTGQTSALGGTGLGTNEGLGSGTTGLSGVSGMSGMGGFGTGTGTTSAAGPMATGTLGSSFTPGLGSGTGVMSPGSLSSVTAPSTSTNRPTSIGASGTMMDTMHLNGSHSGTGMGMHTSGSMPSAAAARPVTAASATSLSAANNRTMSTSAATSSATFSHVSWATTVFAAALFV